MPAGNPLQYAVEAEKNLEALATEFSRMGADEATVDAVTQMAEVCRKIVKTLGEGQEETGDDEPPAPAEQPAPEQPRTVGEATEQLHAETRQSAQRR